MGSNQAAVSFLTNIARAAFGLGISATVLNSSLYTVDGGQRAVLFDRFRGVIDDTVGEGTHFLVPWLQKPFIFDIRTRPHTFSSVSGTKDLQMVHLTLRVLSRPEVSRLPFIFQNLGLEYDEKVLPSIGNEVMKSVVAQFNADQLLTERPQVSALVRESLVRRAKDFNIVLDDVAITHLSYGAEFSKAVEQKQVAQQEAERSKFVVMKAEQERRAAIIRPAPVPAQAPFIQSYHVPSIQSNTPPPPAPEPAPAPIQTPAPSPAAAKSADSSLPPLKSPMAGTFYRSPAPGEPAFVKVGDKVQKGQVLCIIEAMKLMNEIEADRSGTIVEVVAEDGNLSVLILPCLSSSHRTVRVRPGKQYAEEPGKCLFTLGL